MNYLTLIYDYYNVLIKIEERNTATKAYAAGKFWTKRGGWYKIVKPKDKDEYEMYYALLNM